MSARWGRYFLSARGDERREEVSAKETVPRGVGVCVCVCVCVCVQETEHPEAALTLLVADHLSVQTSSDFLCH